MTKTPGSGSAGSRSPQEDRQAIHEALLRYCRGVDRLDPALVQSAYHADAVDEHGPYQYAGETIGAELVKRLGSDYRATSHMILNHTVQLAGDVARTETYYVAVMAEEKNDDTDLVTSVFGRCLDRFEYRHGEWRIARRAVLIDWATVSEQGLLDNEHFDPAAPWMGRRSAQDPSYGHLSAGE